MVFAGSAFACSCAAVEPSEALGESDGAAVVRLLGVEPLGASPSGASQGRFEYRILRVYRGATLRRGATLTLRSSLSGASCGLPQGTGRRYGLFLARYRGRWSSSLCGVIAPARLRAAAAAGASGASGSARCAN